MLSMLLWRLVVTNIRDKLCNLHHTFLGLFWRMAEAFGIAAAVVQILESSAKLRSLWLDIRHGPDDLTDCIRDIQHTAKLLDWSKQLFLAIAEIENEVLIESAEDLQTVLEILREVTSILQISIDSNKYLGRLKIVLKKDELARGRRKFERAQLLLRTAQQNLSL